MLKQGKILIFFNIIFLILFKIKKYKLNVFFKTFLLNFSKRRRNKLLRRSFLKIAPSTKIFKKKFIIALRKLIKKKHRRRFFYKKVVVNKNFSFTVRILKRTFNLIFFQKIKESVFLNKTKDLFLNNIYFYKYKNFKNKSFNFMYKKKCKPKPKVFVSIIRNNFFYLRKIYLNKKLLFISNSKLFDKKIKFKVLSLAANRLLLLNLLKILYKHKIFFFTLIFFIKKKRRVARKGPKRRTKNFLPWYCFTDFLKIHKFFKKNKSLKINVKMKIVFIKSHSKRTEKLKKKRRK